LKLKKINQMKKSLLYVLTLFLCSSFIFNNFELEDDMGMTPVYNSSEYIVFSHKKQIKIGETWLCNVRIYQLKNRVTFQDVDQGIKIRYIFRQLKRISKKLKSGKIMTKNIYTCEPNFPYGPTILTITKINNNTITFGFRDSEYGDEKVYSVKNDGYITNGAENFFGI
jgi:hypothetical protein